LQVDRQVGELERFNVGQGVGAIGTCFVGNGVTAASFDDGVVGKIAAVAGRVNARTAVDAVVARAAGEWLVGWCAGKGLIGRVGCCREVVALTVPAANSTL